MSLEVLVVGGGYHLGFYRALKISDFFRTLVDQQHHYMDFRVILRHRIGNLLEYGGFPRSRRSNDDSARAFANRSNEINDPRLNQVGVRFQTELFDGINSCEILKSNSLRVVLERHFVDFLNGPELWTGTAMRRLRGAGDETAFAQEIALDGVRRHEYVGRLGVKVIGSSSQKSETFLGNLEVTRTVVRHIIIVVSTAHISCIVISKVKNESQKAN